MTRSRLIFTEFEGVIVTASSASKNKDGPLQLSVDQGCLDRLRFLAKIVEADIIFTTLGGYGLNDAKAYQDLIGEGIGVMEMEAEGHPSMGPLIEDAIKLMNLRPDEFLLLQAFQYPDLGKLRGRLVQTNYGGSHQGFTRKHLRRSLHLFGFPNANALSRSLK